MSAINPQAKTKIELANSQSRHNNERVMLDGQLDFNFATAIYGTKNADQHHNLVCSSEILNLPKIHAIYRIVCLPTSREYIGSATILRNRLGNHYLHLKRQDHCNKRLQREWNKYGEDSFRFGVLEEVSDPNQLIPREQYYFDTRKPQLILCKMAGKNATGRIMGPEGRMKLSLARKGKSLSEETKRKLSIARRKRVISIESRIKQSQTWKLKLLQPGVREALIARQHATHVGKHLSDKTKLLISQKIKHAFRNPGIRKKMSDLAIKRYKNPDYKLRWADSMKGRVVTPETKLALSLSHKGKPWSASRREAYEARFGSH